MLTLIGRELLFSELREPLEEIAGIIQMEGFCEKNGQIKCNRCGASESSDRQSAPCACGPVCYYCRRCLQMGKVKRCSLLYSLPESNQFLPLQEPILTWKGDLSQQQQEASQDIIQSIESGETRLIWAVAGAGKTEMIFKGIEVALRNKKRVCIASPRVDVCLELAPRLKKAFQEVEQVVLYGGAEDPYQYTQLVIATTHQLLRFSQAFDVLIIDEIDAFPFPVDQSLQFAAQKAKKTDGTLIYLSATPSKKMQQAIQRKTVAASILPARYHGFPLPEPQLKWSGDWKKAIRQEKRKGAFFKQVEELLIRKRRFLVFLPNIVLMQQLALLLEKEYPARQFATVYAEDPERKEKVLQMRQEAYDFLLTTTILERGVTFRDIDVLVLGAEDPSFTESALVQIAGRAGRHREFPRGLVLFYHHGQTRAIKGAVKQIKRMNRLARERGLVKS
ncbi:MAG: DEAD/DEAH box helicase [Carnobacterium sp.]|uniref:DEAD/DEAH box helicase n=1 Tax=unclassified Carnobacterium TaxID=257487 RepID=UPI001F199A70|nr:DEAD/DEAH box helicase [Carnobacterium sp. CS13]